MAFSTITFAPERFCPPGRQSPAVAAVARLRNVCPVGWLGPVSPTVNAAVQIDEPAREVVPAPLGSCDFKVFTALEILASWALPIVRHQTLLGVFQTLVSPDRARRALISRALSILPSRAAFSAVQAHYLGRALLVIAHSTPQYMLAYLLLQLMGPSMLPAISALALHNGAIAPLAGRRTSLNFGRMHRRDGISPSMKPPRGFTTSSWPICSIAGKSFSGRAPFSAS